MDAERVEIIKFLEEKHIWYMPLKGVILKEFYPEYGLRQMCDNDILFDNDYTDEVRKWFFNRGYELQSVLILNNSLAFR